MEVAVAAQTAEIGVAGETAAAVAMRMAVALEAAVASAGPVGVQPSGVPYVDGEMPVVGT